MVEQETREKRRWGKILRQICYIKAQKSYTVNIKKKPIKKWQIWQIDISVCSLIMWVPF